MISHKRTVILHHHLFKNAGTSLDEILKGNFGSAWVGREFPAQPGGNGDLVATWIEAEPQAIAFSSHTMRGPLPQIANVEIIPILLLRNPISRIKSAYGFERDQQAETVGSRLARQHDFRGYCLAQLEMDGYRQCRDYHVDILAAMTPGPQSELERAKITVTRLRQTGVVGLVEEFDTALSRLAQRVSPVWPQFQWHSVRANTSQHRDAVIVSEELESLLRQANQNDFALIEWIRATQA